MTIQWPNEKRTKYQTTIYKTLYIKLKIEQHSETDNTMTIEKIPNNNLQNTIHKTKDRATQWAKIDMFYLKNFGIVLIYR